MRDVESVIKHHGVKGMRWGVRKSERSTNKTTLKERLGSLKRERQWGKVLGEMDNLTNDEIVKVSKRVGMENSLKRLVKESPIATKSDKVDYVRRANMDDDELNNKIVRLRTKDNLSKAVSSASKEQRELGEKVVNAASSIAMTYVTTKTLTPKDLIDAYTNSKPLKDRVKDKVVKDLIESVTRPK